MKSFRILFLIILISSCNINKRELLVKGDRFQDIGNISISNENIDASASFILKSSNGLIEIQNIELGCNCIGYELSKKDIIGINDSIILNVSFDKSRKGYFQEDVKIFGNFINSPVLLTFQGKVLE